MIFQVGQPLHLAGLFVHITVNDYVPNNLNDFANALANPIDYQNAIEMERVREAQLSILGDEGQEVDSGRSHIKGKYGDRVFADKGG